MTSGVKGETQMRNLLEKLEAGGVELDGAAEEHTHLPRDPAFPEISGRVLLQEAQSVQVAALSVTVSQTFSCDSSSDSNLLLAFFQQCGHLKNCLVFDGRCNKFHFCCTSVYHSSSVKFCYYHL